MNNPIYSGKSDTFDSYGEKYYTGDPPTNTYPYEPFSPTVPYTPWTYPPPNPVKRTTRTIEKYNSKGKLISREIITEEEEIVQPLITWSSGTTVTDHGDYSSSVTDINHPNNQNFSYTGSSNSLEPASVSFNWDGRN